MRNDQPAMPHRPGSPALSENEYDVSSALFPTEDVDPKGNINTSGQELDLGFDFDIDVNGDEESGDEAFIAAQQAASNRKASNIKGKSVKKGGGFQAMGLNSILL
ncbi:ATP-dependent RNA helicase dbp10, partial [Cryomyces antarcticus]